MHEVIPVVLMAYARPVHLARVLACLRENKVPLILAYVDGPKNSMDEPAVALVRALVRSVDWCEVRLVERENNLGLGRNVISSVTEVAATYKAFIVWEDDLVCVPGTYDWMCQALRHYSDDKQVMSISGWTHPRVTPSDVGDQPYFDGRADCWVWGAWARSWKGMEEGTALQKMGAAAARGISPDAYGSDLPKQAGYEERRNVWAVRWLYHHFQQGGLCLRPAWSMVQHIGFDATATNAAGSEEWANPRLRNAPGAPLEWPSPTESPHCAELWRKAGSRPCAFIRLIRKIRQFFLVGFKLILAKRVRTYLRVLFGWRWFRGDYPNWEAAKAASCGYGDTGILNKVLAATLEVRKGRAAFERDGVLFPVLEPDNSLLDALKEIVCHSGGGLRVLDFGGALGTNYWRHRAWLPSGDGLRWDVVEQAAFNESGRKFLADTPLRFYEDAQSAYAEGKHDVLLCSGVLQYIEEPFRYLEEWRNLSVPFLLLNNLPLHNDGPHRLRVQHVPPSIYPGSYPVWFFNRRIFMNYLAKDYDILREFDSEAVWPVDSGLFQSTGLLLRRRRVS